MRYLKAAKFQHVKLKNLNTDLLPYGKRNAEMVKIWSYFNKFLAGCLDELMMPGPLKCFRASNHQIFTKSASQKARIRNKA